MSFLSRKQPELAGRRRVADRVDGSTPPPVARPQFRRNQTISSIKRDPMDPSHSPRARLHHLTTHRRKVSGILLLIILGIIVLGFFVTQLTARVVISGTSDALSRPVRADLYESAINDYLGQHPVSRLRFALDEADLSRYVTAVAPEVAAISQNNGAQLIETRYTLTFRRPVAGWQINGRQYYVDATGVVFQNNYYQAPAVQIVDESGVSPEQGTTVASARLLSFVGRVVSLSKENGYGVGEAILPIGTTRQLEIRMDGIAPRIKLSIDRGAGEQVEDMSRAVKFLTDRGQLPAEYIDVRVSGKAVYR